MVGTLVRAMGRFVHILRVVVVCGVVAPAQASRTDSGAGMAGGVRDGASPVVEISQAPRIGTWSCWLSNGVRLHAKTLAPAAEESFAIVVTITGGELLEPPGRRGLADAAASAWSLPKDPEGARAEVVRRYLDSQVRFRGVAHTDCLQLVLTGPEEDLGLAAEIARVLIEQPGLDSSAFAGRVGSLRAGAEEALRDPGRMMIDALRPLSLPASMSAARAFGLADVAALESPQGAGVAAEWLSGVLMQGSIEVGIASRVGSAEALGLVSSAFGPMTTRPRIGPETLREFREAAPAPMKEAISLRCERAPGEAPRPASLGVAFLGPHRERLAERRALALATFIIDARAEAALNPRRAREAGDSMPRVRTYPVNPGARSAVSMVAIVLADREADSARKDDVSPLIKDLATLERLITELATIGPLPDELDEAKGAVARILAAQDLSADAWAIKLATLTYDGLTPASLANAIDSYQAITIDEVRRTLAEWWTPTRENSRADVTRIYVTTD